MLITYNGSRSELNRVGPLNVEFTRLLRNSSFSEPNLRKITEISKIVDTESAKATSLLFGDHCINVFGFSKNSQFTKY